MRKFTTLSSDITIFLNGDRAAPVTKANFDTFFGTSGSDDPMIAFCDSEQLISSEQYSYYGRWRGWKHEIIDDKKEYFLRKLAGK